MRTVLIHFTHNDHSYHTYLPYEEVLACLDFPPGVEEIHLTTSDKDTRGGQMLWQRIKARPDEWREPPDPVFYFAPSSTAEWPEPDEKYTQGPPFDWCKNYQLPLAH